MSVPTTRPNGSAWQRPALRPSTDSHRPVGWIELFFDLVFVVIIAVLAHDLEYHLDAAGVLHFAVLFLAVFWVWNAFTYYTERFESAGLETRLFTFIALLAVAGLAVWGEDGLGDNYLGFALAYVLARSLNISMWLRAARHERVFRPAALSFLCGYGVAVALIVVSLAVDPAARAALFAAAVLAEIVTPAVSARTQVALPAISRDKFPERFGLLTILVLGETVAGVIRGVAEANETEDLSGLTILSAALGLAIGFGLWWVYFDFVARRPSRPNFVTALAWVYLHIGMLFAIVVAGVGVAAALLARPSDPLAPEVRLALFGGVAASLLCIAAIEFTLDRTADEPTHPVTSPLVKVAAAVLLGLAALALPQAPLPAAMALPILALAAPAVYGVTVWYRPRDAAAARTPQPH